MSNVNRHANPIDNIMLQISKNIDPIFRNMKYSPIGITIASSIFGVASLYSLYNKNVTMFTVYAVLSYLFDITTDTYTQNYNLAHDKRIDRLKNLVLVLATAYIIYAKYNAADSTTELLVMAALFVLCVMYVNCQNTKNKNELIQSIMPNKYTCRKYIDYLKWFGPGTFFVAVLCFVWYLDQAESITETITCKYVNPALVSNIENIMLEPHEFQRLFYQTPNTTWTQLV